MNANEYLLHGLNGVNELEGILFRVVDVIAGAHHAEGHVTGGKVVHEHVSPPQNLIWIDVLFVQDQVIMVGLRDLLMSYSLSHQCHPHLLLTHWSVASFEPNFDHLSRLLIMSLSFFPFPPASLDDGIPRNYLN